MEFASFMSELERRNPGQPEFLQAAHEVAEKVVPYINRHPEYEEARILERIAEPDRVVSFRVTWEDDEGRVQINRGYRIQQNNALGPYKGGLRFDPDVNLSVLKFLAFEQVFKNSLTSLPMGGGKGGSDFDPKGKSDAEVMRFCQSFMTELHRHIGEDTDVPAGDIGVGGREIGYLFGQYKRLRNAFTGVMTGKGAGWGGSHLRPEATGYGSVYFAQEMLHHRGDDLHGKRCVISGAGNVSQYTAEKLIDLGAHVLTLSDRGGTMHFEGGLTHERLAEVMDLKNERRGELSSLAGAGARFESGAHPWGVPCDCAFPSAVQNELDDEAAQALLSNGCVVISEGANMPCTPDAARRFEEAGVCFGPGKAANAGGVATSGLEMTQNSMRQSWSREEVDRRLREIMAHVHAECVRYGSAGDGRVNYVQGANVGGFVKVADAMLAYGIV
jgi:glutamate dehydrogenase (NADP+)